MSEKSSDHSFWPWSAAAYERQGVPAALLRLQDDAGLNVNILLWCLWCAERYAEIPELAIRKAADIAATWSAEVTENLRRTRRALKSPPDQADADAAKALRKKIKKAELDAEEIEQAMLERLAADQLEPSATPTAEERETRARRNLAAYAALAGAANHEGFNTALLETLIAAVDDRSREAVGDDGQ